MLKKLDLLKEAIDVFVESIHKVPTNWSTWLELSMLITDKDMVNNIHTIYISIFFGTLFCIIFLVE